MHKSVTLGRMSENVRKCRQRTALHRGATCRQAESCAHLAGRKGKSAAGGEGGGGLSRCLSSHQPINSWRDEPGDFETGAPQLVGLTQTTQSWSWLGPPAPGGDLPYILLLRAVHTPSLTAPCRAEFLLLPVYNLEGQVLWCPKCKVGLPNVALDFGSLEFAESRVSSLWQHPRPGFWEQRSLWKLGLQMSCYEIRVSG